MAINVACLYRVSTKTQLTGDDIPLQRNACSTFVHTQPDWQIVTEYIERGVSGYQKSMEQRDVLIQIKNDAAQRKFEILLVYMFDRLGRREDETPLVAEWLAERGVTVWSVTEGPQHFNGCADRLVNYMRFWQSAGESANTSLRVAEKHRQMVLDGQYRGGPPPYGYKLVPSGLYNKKGRERQRLTVDEAESAVVRMIYALRHEQSLPYYTIAKHLNELQLVTRNGHVWTTPAVARMVKNPIYKGEYVSGKVINKRGLKIKQDREKWTRARELMPELAVIDHSVWEAVNAKVDGQHIQHSHSVNEKKHHLLLMGVLYCGYCGARLSAGGRGTRYDCPRRMRLDACDGSYGYGAKKVENAVWDEMTRFMATHCKAKTFLSKLDQKKKGLEREKATLHHSVMRSLSNNGGTESTQLAERLDNINRMLTHLQEEKIRLQNTPEALIKTLDRLNTADRRSFITVILTHAAVTRDKIIIKLRIEVVI